MKKDISAENEEIKTILKLLDEYSLKLNPLVERWNVQRRRAINLGFLLAAVLLGIGITTTILLFNQETIQNRNYISYYATAITIVILVTFLQLLKLENKKLQSIEENIFLLESKLEKLVRKASQYEEHVKIDRNLALELDLKLADAEATLRMTQQTRLRKNNRNHD